VIFSALTHTFLTDEKGTVEQNNQSGIERKGKESYCVANFATFVPKLCFTFPLKKKIV